MHTRNIAVAEHAVAWLCGYLCGVRPRCMAPSPFKPTIFNWKNIVITRQLEASGGWHGKFRAEIQFDFLKTAADNINDDEARVLRVIIGSPVHRTIFSLPHRLLVMLLRRGYLEDHESLESLMNSRKHQIVMKKEAFNQPVFLSVSPRGLKLGDEPARSRSFTDYLKLRAQWIGYPFGISFYSWRRKFATQVDRLMGAEQARKAMDHCPMSRIYESHYDQGLYDMDPTSRLVDGNNNPDKSSIESHVSLAVHKAMLIRSSSARDLKIEKFVEKHEEVREPIRKGATDEIKNVKRRVRKYALAAALLAEERELQSIRTIEEVKARIEELQKPSKFEQMIRARSNELASQDNGSI